MILLHRRCAVSLVRGATYPEGLKLTMSTVRNIGAHQEPILTITLAGYKAR
jgi:hypothetical protein